jgi:hypothetical protein
MESTPPVGITCGRIRQDIAWVVIWARGEEVCRLAIPVEEVMGDTPYTPPLLAEGVNGQRPTG